MHWYTANYSKQFGFKTSHDGLSLGSNPSSFTLRRLLVNVNFSVEFTWNPAVQGAFRALPMMVFVGYFTDQDFTADHNPEVERTVDWLYSELFTMRQAVTLNQTGTHNVFMWGGTDKPRSVEGQRRMSAGHQLYLWWGIPSVIETSLNGTNIDIMYRALLEP